LNSSFIRLQTQTGYRSRNASRCVRTTRMFGNVCLVNGMESEVESRFGQ